MRIPCFALLFSGCLFCLLGCTTSVTPPAAPQDQAEPEAIEALEPQEETMPTLNEDHLRLHGELRLEEVLPRAQAAFAWYSEQPHWAAGRKLGSLEELTQEHFVEITAREGLLDLHVYPATPPIAWEMTFTINEEDEIEEMVVATLEEAPMPFPEDLDE